MKYAVIAARTLVGLVFVVFGLNAFLTFIPMEPPSDMPEAAKQFGGAFQASGYVYAVKVFEVLGGALLLSGRFPLLGLAMILPISLNILFFELFLMKQPGLGVVLVPLCLFILFGYRKAAAPVFAPSPPIG